MEIRPPVFRTGDGWWRRSAVSMLCGALVLSVSACGGDDADASRSTTVHFATKENFAYLPIYVMIDEGILKKHIPGVKIEFMGVNSSVDAANGVVSGRVDATIAGTTSFLTAWANHVPWKIASGSSTAQIKLIAKKGRYQRLADIGAKARIAYPSPGSIQDLVLAMAAKNQLGDANDFKNRLQPLGEPDASNALKSGNVDLDFTQSPFSDKLLADPGYTTVLDSKDVVGKAALAVFVLSDKFSRSDPKVRAALATAFAETLDFINQNPEKAAQVALNHKIGTDLAADKASIAANTYGKSIEGIETLATFMSREGFIKREAKATEYVDESVYRSLG